MLHREELKRLGEGIEDRVRSGVSERGLNPHREQQKPDSFEEMSAEYMLFFLPETLEVGTLKMSLTNSRWSQQGGHSDLLEKDMKRGPGKTPRASDTHRT